MVPSLTLETVIIRPSRRSQMVGTIPCNETQKLYATDLDRLDAIQTKVVRSIISGFSSKLQSWPNSRHILILTSIRHWGDSVDVLVGHDVVTNTTTAYPIADAGWDRNTCDPLLLLRYATIFGTPQDAIGCIGDIEELVEGESW